MKFSETRYMVPAWNMKVETLETYRKNCQAKLEKNFEKVGYQRVIRAILPDDLGLSDWLVQDRPWINYYTCYPLVIFRISILKLPVCASEIKIASSATTIFVDDFAELRGIEPILTQLQRSTVEEVFDILAGREISAIFGDLRNIRMEAYLSTPIFFDGNIRVELDKLGDEIALGGFICEPSGCTVS